MQVLILPSDIQPATHIGIQDESFVNLTWKRWSEANTTMPELSTCRSRFLIQDTCCGAERGRVSHPSRAL